MNAFEENPGGVLRTVRGVMELYNLSRPSVMRLAEAAGAIIRIGKRVVRIDVDRFDAFVRGGQDGAAANTDGAGIRGSCQS